MPLVKSFHRDLLYPVEIGYETEHRVGNDERGGEKEAVMILMYSRALDERSVFVGHGGDVDGWWMRLMRRIRLE